MSRFPLEGVVRIAVAVLLCSSTTLLPARPIAAQTASPAAERTVSQAAASPADDLSPTSPPDTTLRLSSLLQEASRANPSLRAARLRAAARRTEPAQTSALPDPVVGSTVYADPIITARGAQRTQWRAEQSIPFPGLRSLRGDVADLRAEGAEADADALAQTLALQIRRAYYTLYRVQEEQRTIRRFQTDLRQFEEAALAQYEVGEEGQPAVLKAQIERQRLDIRLQTLAAERASALQQLVRLTGERSLADDSVTVAPPSPPSPPSPSSTEAPLDRRPEATALRTDIERAETEISVARKESWPDFTVGVQYVDIARRDLTPTMTGRDALALSVGIQVPLWRGKQKASVREAELERRRARADLDAFELEVRTRIADLQAAIQRQNNQLDLLDNRLLPKAETALATTLSAYRTGSTGFLDLLDAQRTLFELQLQRIAVYTRLLQTTAELERAAGRSSLPVSAPPAPGR